MFDLGALCFGFVVGWITYRTLRRSKTTGLSDIATVIGAVGGAAVLSLFPAKTEEFDSYSIGLLIGFLAYLVVAGLIEYFGGSKINKWLGTSDEGF